MVSHQPLGSHDPQAILIKDNHEQLVYSLLGPIEVKAFRKHHRLEILVLLFLPKPLLLQKGHQSITLLHHLQHLTEDLLFLSKLFLCLKVV